MNFCPFSPLSHDTCLTVVSVLPQPIYGEESYRDVGPGVPIIRVVESPKRRTRAGVDNLSSHENPISEGTYMANSSRKINVPEDLPHPRLN